MFGFKGLSLILSADERINLLTYNVYVPGFQFYTRSKEAVPQAGKKRLAKFNSFLLAGIQTQDMFSITSSTDDC